MTANITNITCIYLVVCQFYNQILLLHRNLIMTFHYLWDHFSFTFYYSKRKLLRNLIKTFNLFSFYHTSTQVSIRTYPPFYAQIST